MTSPSLNISFIGFGEAARAFCDGFASEGLGCTQSAFDLKGAALQQEAAKRHVALADSNAQVCAGADAIFSLVTADKAANAAETSAQRDLNTAFFLDCNSCAPDTKRRSAALIEAAGGRYVDVAVMTPVHPKLHKSPCLIAGPHARVAQDLMQTLGMDATIAGDHIGDASTPKMIRSIMIKGLEALTLECFLAARTAGIEGDIQASLDAAFPGFDWGKRAPYMMERMATHGIRRAAEMDEVAQTLRDLGIAPHITERTVVRQREVGALGLKVSTEDAKDLAKLADTILDHLNHTSHQTHREE